MSGVDQIMRLADEWYAHGQTSHSGIDEKYAALRAAVEQVIAENLQRGNVIGRIAAHLLGRQNNVTDEDVVVAAARIGGELLGANTRAKRAEDDLMAAHNAVAQMMIRQSIATGHGDTVADMVAALEPHIVALRKVVSPPRITAEQVEELKRLADEAERSAVDVAVAECAVMMVDPGIKYKRQQLDEDRAALHAALDALVAKE